MRYWKTVLVGASALTFAAMPMAGAFAQMNGGGHAMMEPPIPSQRITMNRAAGTGVSIGVSPAGVRRIQQELNRLGYAAGDLTGRWDRSTQNAVVNFQKARGLEPTGNLNFSTIAALGLTREIVLNPMYPGMPSSELAQSARAATPTVAGAAGDNSRTLASNGASDTGTAGGHTNGVLK